MIAPELAALTSHNLTVFVLGHTRSFDDVKRRAACNAYTACVDRDFDKARRLLTKVGLVPEAPSLLPAQPSLLDGLR